MNYLYWKHQHVEMLSYKKKKPKTTTTHFLLSSKIFSLRPFSSVPSSLEMAFFMSLRDANSTTLYKKKQPKNTETFTRTKVWRSEAILGVWKLRTSSHPSFLLGLCASTKVTSPAFLIRSFRSCFKPQRRFSGRENTAGCQWEPFRPAGRNVSKQKKPKHNDTVINYWLLSLSDMLPFQWRACQQKSNR